MDKIEVARFYRRRDVERLTGLPKSTLYARMSNGDFPKPFKIGSRAVAWRGSDLAMWAKSRAVAP